jgi:hypothetical protein
MQLFDIGIIKTDKKYSPMSLVIYQRTSSWWTHCVLFKNDKGDIWDPTIGGILDHNISHYADREISILTYKYSYDEAKLLEWVDKKQKGCKGYDYLALFGFLTGIKAFEDEERWYCAELPYWLFQDNGYLLTSIDKKFVYPNDLYLNMSFIHTKGLK